MEKQVLKNRFNKSLSLPQKRRQYVGQGTLTAGNTKGESITVLLTSCLTGLESAVLTTDKFCFYLQNRLIQTSQTGGQRYNDTSPFSIPCLLNRKAQNS